MNDLQHKKTVLFFLCIFLMPYIVYSMENPRQKRIVELEEIYENPETYLALLPELLREYVAQYRAHQSYFDDEKIYHWLCEKLTQTLPIKMVTSAYFSPKGTYIFGKTKDGSNYLFNTKTQQLIEDPLIHKTNTQLFLSPQETYAIVGNPFFSTTQVIDVSTLQVQTFIEGEPDTITFSSDDRYGIASYRNGRFAVFNTTNHQPLDYIGNHINNAIFSPNAQFLAVRYTNETAAIFNLFNPKKLNLDLPDHIVKVGFIAFSNDSTYALVQSLDQYNETIFTIFDLKTLQPLKIEFKDTIKSFLRSPAENYAIIIYENYPAEIYNFETQTSHKLPTDPEKRTNIHFSPYGRYLIIQQTDEYDQTVRKLYDIPMQETHDLPDGIFNSTFIPHNKYIFIEYENEKGELIDTTTLEPIQLDFGKALSAIKVSNDGTYILREYHDKPSLFDISKLKKIITINGLISSANFSPDSTYLMYLEAHQVKILPLNITALLNTLSQDQLNLIAYIYEHRYEDVYFNAEQLNHFQNLPIEIQDAFAYVPR